MTITVRAMTEDDDLDHLDEDNPLHSFTVMYRDMGRSGMEMHWFVGELDGKPVGMIGVCPLPVAAGGFGAGVVSVRAEARRRGVGRVLRRAVEESARGRVPGVLYAFQEGTADSEAAVAAWELTPSERHHESVLHLRAIDRGSFAARAEVDGLLIAELPSFAEISDDEWRELHAFTQERFREAPDSADGGGLLPYEAFRGLLEEPWMMVTAREDGVFVGITFVARRGVDMNTFFTGVSETGRRRGIAGAMKAAQALAMAERGVARLYTQNMQGNEPILAANRSMGFVPNSTYADVTVPLPA